MSKSQTSSSRKQSLKTSTPQGVALACLRTPTLHPHFDEVLVVAVAPRAEADVVPVKVARVGVDENRHQAVDAALLLDVLDHAKSGVAVTGVIG